MIKKIAKKITQICVALAVMVVPFISTMGQSYNNVIHARTNANEPQTVIELNDGSDSEINQQESQELIDTLYGSSGATIEQLTSYASTPKKASQLNSGTSIYVEFGGLEWLVTYLSLNTDGDPIATLWLSDQIDLNNDGDIDADDKSTWSSGWSSELKTNQTNYPSNMYENSYIRSVLNGTNYVQAYTDSEKTAAATGYKGSTTLYYNMITTGVQANVFKPFTGTYDGVNLTRYITKPEKVSWQASGQSYTVLNDTYSGWEYDFPNCNYNVTANASSIVGGKFYENMDYTSYVNGETGTYNSETYLGNSYGDWKNDYLWLPSLVEVGYELWDDSLNDWDGGYTGESSGSIWGTTAAQRAFGTGDDDEWLAQDLSWLRSGSSDYAARAWTLYPSGNNYSDYGVDISYAVRPSLHINLKSVISSAIADSGIFVDVVLPTVFVILVGSLSAMYIHSTKQQRERKLLFK